MERETSLSSGGFEGDLEGELRGELCGELCGESLGEWLGEWLREWLGESLGESLGEDGLDGELLGEFSGELRGEVEGGVGVSLRLMCGSLCAFLAGKTWRESKESCVWIGEREGEIRLWAARARDAANELKPQKQTCELRLRKRPLRKAQRTIASGNPTQFLCLFFIHDQTVFRRRNRAGNRIQVMLFKLVALGSSA